MEKILGSGDDITHTWKLFLGVGNGVTVHHPYTFKMTLSPVLGNDFRSVYVTLLPASANSYVEVKNE
jgi:hypothetical protein